jgi:hypothetical protein
MDQAIDPHQDAGSASEILEAVNPVAVDVGLLDSHGDGVAHGLLTSSVALCDAERSR